MKLKKVSCDYCDKAVREVLILEEVSWFADVATSKKGERKKSRERPLAGTKILYSVCPGNCKRSLAAVTPIIVASFVHRTVNFDRKSRRLCKYAQGDEEEKEDEEEEEEYPKEDCESRRR